MSATQDGLEAVNEVGPRVAQAIAEFFAEERNRALVQDLQQLGFRMPAPQRPAGGALEGKTVVLTGTFPTLSREEAKERIEAAGGKAAALEVEVVDETELLRRLNER